MRIIESIIIKGRKQRKEMISHTNDVTIAIWSKIRNWKSKIFRIVVQKNKALITLRTEGWVPKPLLWQNDLILTIPSGGSRATKVNATERRKRGKNKQIRINTTIILKHSVNKRNYKILQNKKVEKCKIWLNSTIVRLITEKI